MKISNPDREYQVIMKEITNEEIEHLAENIAIKWSTGIPVDPYLIAKKQGIDVIEGKGYEFFFKGIIIHKEGRFFIILNMDRLQNPSYTMSKYTLAHELGHFFIKAHRDLLKKGISIPYTGIKSADVKVKKREDQAQLFAAALLMPKSIFIEQARNLSSGFEAIINLALLFNTAILSAAIRYTHLDIIPSIQILCNENGIRRKNISDSFSKLIGKNPLMKYNPDRHQMDKEKVLVEMTESNQIKFYRSITHLSSWVFNLSEIGADDILVYEETFHCKTYSLTLLRIVE